MIKLDLPPKPAELTDERIQELTAQYRVDGSDVWNKQFIRDAVLKIAFGKCCYSESMLDEEGKYMEIDHFYPKKWYPGRVVEWGNLLPANKKCNTTKSDHNPAIEPIINPCIDNPKDHLYIKAYRFYPKTEIGKKTIEVVALNDRQHFVKSRAKIGHEILETLNNIYDELIEDRDAILSSIRKQKQFQRKIKALLQSATRENVYSATISTTILMDEYFPLIEFFLRENQLWDQELADLKNELLFCALMK